jgi:hypothetical protein
MAALAAAEQQLLQEHPQVVLVTLLAFHLLKVTTAELVAEVGLLIAQAAAVVELLQTAQAQ